jgi:hypothetical protein
VKAAAEGGLGLRQIKRPVAQGLQTLLLRFEIEIGHGARIRGLPGGEYRYF